MSKYSGALFVGWLLLCIQLVRTQTQFDDGFAKLNFEVEGLIAGQADNNLKMASFQEFQASAEAAGEANLDAVRAAQEAAYSAQRARVDALFAENKEKISALQAGQAEDKEHAKEIQMMIDALAEQTSELTKKLTAHFTTPTSADNKTRLATNGQQPRRTNVLQISSGGITYIRWGRTTCAGTNDTVSKVYDGYAGNSHYGSTSGGTNFLCLHNTPVLTTSLTGISARGSIRGVEYYFANIPFSTTNNGGLSFSGKDMPCVACNADTKSHQIMIPARSDCPSGWTLEYWGYLISSNDYSSSFYKSSYICLDNSPEIIAASAADSYSNYAVPVAGFCGSTFPCPPYVNNQAIPCAVCSI